MEEKELGRAFGISKATCTTEQLEAMIAGKSEQYKAGARDGYKWAQTQDVAEPSEETEDGDTDRPSFGGPSSFGDEGGMDEGGEDEPMDFGDSAKNINMAGNQIKDEEKDDLEIVEKDGGYKVARRYDKDKLKEAKEDKDEDPDNRSLEKDGDDILVVEDDESLDYNESDFALTSSEVKMDGKKRRRHAHRSVLEEAIGEMENISDGFVSDLEEKAVASTKKTLGDKVAAQVDTKGYAISRKSGMFVFSKAWAQENGENCIKGVTELMKPTGLTVSAEILSAFLDESMDVDGDIAVLQVSADALKTAVAKALKESVKVKSIA